MLPVELLLQIFEQLHDDRPTLLNLLVVSHHISRLSESVLYADITLKIVRPTLSSNSRSITRFVNSLGGPLSCRCRGSLVKGLRLDGSDAPNIAQAEYTLIDLILSKLPNLQSLHFIHLQSPVMWSPFASKTTTTPPFQLTRLIFDGVMPPSYASKMVNGFLASQTKLEHLEIGSIIAGAFSSNGTIVLPLQTLSSVRILETSTLEFLEDVAKSSKLTHLKLSSSAGSRLDTLNHYPNPNLFTNLRVLSTLRTPRLPSIPSRTTTSSGPSVAMILPNLEYWELCSEWVDLTAFFKDPYVYRFLASLPRLRGIRFSAQVATHPNECIEQAFENILGLEFIEVRRKGAIFCRYYRGEEMPRLMRWHCKEGYEWRQDWQQDGFTGPSLLVAKK